MQADEQQALIAWIWGQSGAAAPAGVQGLGARTREQGLQAYREHAKALARRAFAAAYPRLCAWLGEADSAGLAWAFARAHPPQQGDMNCWGAALPAFLATLPGMEAEPQQLARLDWALHQLALAPAPPAPDAGLWTALQQQAPEQLRLRVHGQGLQVQAALLADEAPGLPGLPDASAGDCLWVWRAAHGPAWLRIPAPCFALLAALQQAPSLAAALEQALAEQPALAEDGALAAALQSAWQQGWLLGAERVDAV